MPRRVTATSLLAAAYGASALQVGVPASSPVASACRRAPVAPMMAVDDKVRSMPHGDLISLAPFEYSFTARLAVYIAALEPGKILSNVI